MKKAIWFVIFFILWGIFFRLIKLAVTAGKVMMIELLGKRGEILINAVGIAVQDIGCIENLKRKCIFR
ncbi:hypothetical protein [Crassaminicella profunda]|uniref:hypothetical protein n=1 Tax=Crassaminicella profunda TaxID=1286698 RepID=UPI001CA74220|nr:hypothetical protein [Crassaminicella profunda]QZY56061.1 hypothetical protein K7H06_03405 [Crassaminicella profunda]